MISGETNKRQLRLKLENVYKLLNKIKGEFVHETEFAHPDFYQKLSSNFDFLVSILGAFDNFLLDKRNLWPKSELELTRFILSEMHEDNWMYMHFFTQAESIPSTSERLVLSLTNYIHYITSRRVAFNWALRCIGKFGENYDTFNEIGMPAKPKPLSTTESSAENMNQLDQLNYCLIQCFDLIESSLIIVGAECRRPTISIKETLIILNIGIEVSIGMQRILKQMNHVIDQLLKLNDGNAKVHRDKIIAFQKTVQRMIQHYKDIIKQIEDRISIAESKREGKSIEDYTSEEQSQIWDMKYGETKELSKKYQYQEQNLYFFMVKNGKHFWG